MEHYQNIQIVKTFLIKTKSHSGQGNFLASSSLSSATTILPSSSKSTCSLLSVDFALVAFTANFPLFTLPSTFIKGLKRLHNAFLCDEMSVCTFPLATEDRQAHRYQPSRDISCILLLCDSLRWQNNTRTYHKTSSDLSISFDVFSNNPLENEHLEREHINIDIP